MGRKQVERLVPESTLRLIWRSRELREVRLLTNENQPMEIITPGEPNTDSGPDFRNAVIRIGGMLYRGDVEIHRRNKEWFVHKHHHDAAYNSVILHVIWQNDLKNSFPATQSGRVIPLLILDRYFEPTHPLLRRRAAEYDSHEPSCAGLSFSPQLRENSSLIRAWICKLGMRRIELKVRRFDERLHELIENQRRSFKEPRQRYGIIPFGVDLEELHPPKLHYSPYEAREKRLWEQLLYEGCMEALGYSKNQEPFLQLARNLPLNFVMESCSETPEADRVESVESLFFGSARLLAVPRKEMDHESKKKLRRLRVIYRKLKRNHPHGAIQKSAWRFFRLRPENFPTIRLAGASYLCVAIAGRNIFREIIQCIKEQDVPPAKKFRMVSSMLLVPAVGFWKNHYRFGEFSSRSGKMLVGCSRSKEMVVNVVIPLALLYARIFKDRCVRESCVALLQTEVALPMNSVVCRIKETLFPGKNIQTSVQLYQGILHLHKSYCVSRRCALCEIPIMRR